MTIIRTIRLLFIVALLCTGISFGYGQGFYTEAPMLAEQVASGMLPPVDERMPSVPLVLQPEDASGTFGGTLVVLDENGNALATIIGYEPLLRWDSQWLRPQPNLAQSIEASEDAMTYTVRLREGVRWSDGEPFNADDVMFAYQSVLLNTDIRRSPPLWLRSGGEPATLEKIDDYTLVFQFSSPNGLFPLRLANNAGNDLTRYPHHYLEQFHPDFNPDADEQAVSAGYASWVEQFNAKAAFAELDLPVLTAWHMVERGEQEIAERNPYYWKVDTNFNQLPYIDRVVFHATTTLEDYTAAIQPQDMQAVLTFDDAFTSFSVYDADNSGLQSISLINSNSTTLAVGLNLNHPDPVLQAAFSDRNFRIALSHAIDRERIVTEVFNGQSRPYQVAPRPESPYYSEQMATQYTEYDPALAEQMLDDGGYGERDADGFRLGLDGTRIHFALQTEGPNTDTLRILNQIAESWQAIGIDVVVQDFAGHADDYTDLLFAGAHDTYISEAVGGLDVIMQPSFYFPLHPFASWYASGWANWNINPPLGMPVEPPDSIKRQFELYAQIQTTIDQDEQAALMSELLQISSDEFLIMGTVLDPDDHMLISPTLHNVPGVMPRGFDYPAPAPSNPAQYFIDG